MQKISLVFIFLFMQMLLMSPVLFSQSSPGIPQVNHQYCLTYLLAPDEQPLEREIERLKTAIEEASPELTAEELDRLKYAAGVLHSYLYIRMEEKQDAYQAVELLEEAQERFARQNLFTVHLGMAHAFVASIRTIFGVSNLKTMEEQLQSIPEKHSDWLIRFLRGTTSLQVGRALPGVFTIKEIKEKAVQVGSEDLRYVLEVYRREGVPGFDPESYDFSRMPVPRPIAEKARSVLN